MNFVAEVKKMDIVSVDEAHIVSMLQENDAEQISFEQFKAWSHGALLDSHIYAHLV